MHRRFGGSTLAISVGAVVVLLTLAAMRPPAQALSGAVPRLQGKPNLSGIWQALTEANWDIRPHQARPGPSQFGALFSEPAGLGMVDGGEIPYQPWAAAQQKENFAKRWELDPEAKCYMPGVPRATSVSVSDHPGHQQDRYRVRVCERQPAHPHGHGRRQPG